MANGLTVLVGSRNFERGEAAATEIGSSAIPLQLDVTDRVSIATAAERIRKEFGRLDLLVNNAAISNTRKGSLSLQEYAKITLASNASLDEVRTVWETNVFGVLAVYQAMLPLLHQFAGRTHRQCIERSRLADGERGPGFPLPRLLRPGVPCVQGGSQRDHVGHDGRVGVDRDQSQSGRRRDSQRRISTDMRALSLSRTAPARWCALHCSARMARQVHSRVGKT